jgi:hypothetical protein
VRWDAPIEHGASAALLLADLLLSRTPIVSYHCQAPLLFVTAYAAFMWAWAGATGEWLYEIRWDEGADLVGYAVLAVFVGLSFLLLLLLAGLRELLAAGRCRAACCCTPGGEEHAAPRPSGASGAEAGKGGGGEQCIAATTGGSGAGAAVAHGPEAQSQMQA